MREIKFRAFDHQKNMMRYDVTGFEGIGNAEMKGVFLDGEYHRIGGKDGPLHVLTANVMQFTGLYDKNGKEIYEGDWIQCEVMGIDAKCCVVFDRGFFGLSLLGTSPLYLAKNIKVLGNKFENPELLTNQKE